VCRVLAIPAGAVVELLTVGHGPASEAEFTSLLGGAGIDVLVDVRTAPGSRRHPHVARAAMEEWVPAAGISYGWEPGLGGWRKPDGGIARLGAAQRLVPRLRRLHAHAALLGGARCRPGAGGARPNDRDVLGGTCTGAATA
jgi:hypothetical protein